MFGLVDGVCTAQHLMKSAITATKAMRTVRSSTSSSHRWAWTRARFLVLPGGPARSRCLLHTLPPWKTSGQRANGLRPSGPTTGIQAGLRPINVSSLNGLERRLRKEVGAFVIETQAVCSKTGYSLGPQLVRASSLLTGVLFVFASVVGEPMIGLVRRLRMERAAFRLMHTEESVAEISREVARILPNTASNA